MTFSDQDVVSDIDDDEDDVYGEDTTANDEGSTPLGNTLEKSTNLSAQMNSKILPKRL